MTVGSVSLQASPATIVSYTRTDLGRKTVRYAAVSVIAIAVSLVTNTLCYGVLRWDKTPSQLAAFVTSTIPSYYLNRAWVWRKNGKSSLHKEVIPFWAIGIIQLAISLAFVRWAQGVVENATDSHGIRTIGFLFNNLCIYGVMWVGKFMFFNKILFVHKPHPDETTAARDTV
jgi:putative flippase GtrA